MRMLKDLARVETWADISISDSLLHLAFVGLANSPLTNLYIPIKTPTAAGMPEQYTYTRIGLDSDEIADVYETLFGGNFFIVPLLKKWGTDDDDVTPYSTSLVKLQRKINNVYKLNKGKYLKIAEGLGFEWNPLYNVDGVEKYTSLENSGVNDSKTEHKYTQRTDTLTDTFGAQKKTTGGNNTRTGSETTSGGKTETHDNTNSVTTFDSTEFSNTDHSNANDTISNDAYTTEYNSVKDADTHTTDTDAYTDTHQTAFGAHTDEDNTSVTHHNAKNGDDEYSGGVDGFGNTVVGGDKYHTDIKERKGNIGVTKTTELLSDAFEFYKNNLLKMFFEDINEQILVRVFEL